jgi:hypothetical protein
VTITNTGDWELVVGSTVLQGGDSGDFQITDDNCSGPALPAGASCEIKVVMTPTVAGSRSTTLDVSSNAPGQPVLGIPVTGGAETRTGRASPNSIAFGPQQIGTLSSAQRVSVVNTGQLPLSVTGIALVGKDAEDFIQENSCMPAPIPVGGSCSALVRQVPSENGGLAATLRVSTDDPDSPYFVQVAGVGDSIPPVVAITGPRRSRKNRVTYSFSANEPVASFGCRVNFKEPVVCTSPYRTPKLAPRRYLIRVQAVDLAGNLGVTPQPLKILKSRRKVKLKQGTG